MKYLKYLALYLIASFAVFNWYYFQIEILPTLKDGCQSPYTFSYDIYGYLMSAAILLIALMIGGLYVFVIRFLLEVLPLKSAVSIISIMLLALTLYSFCVVASDYKYCGKEDAIRYIAEKLNL